MAIRNWLVRRSQNGDYRAGMAAFNHGDLDTALAAFHRVLAAPRWRSDPVHCLAAFYAAEAAHQLGLRCLEADDVHAARDSFVQARAVNAHFPQLLYHTAIAAALDDDWDLCQCSVAEVLALNPQHVEAGVLHALCSYRDREDEPAAAALRRALAQTDSQPLSMLLLRVLDRSAQHSPQLRAVLRASAAERQTARA